MRSDQQNLSGEHEPSGLFGLQLATALALLLFIAGCTQTRAPTVSPPETDGGTWDAASSGGAARDAPPVPTKPAQIDEDGNDDLEDPGEGHAPEHGRFEKVGTPPLALTRICDLTLLGDALYAAHAHQPLGLDGATVTRYRPDDPKRPFSVAFDWNRPGEPTKGGGAGQGFLRVHAIGGGLFVPDSDPPYNGLGVVEHGTEGYVFVSDAKGAFAPPRAPHYQAPVAPDLGAFADGRAGAAVLPRAYHVLDAIRFRGALYASTGSVPPKERAWRGPSPGALHRANADGSRWLYEIDYPFPWNDTVTRLTFMVRFLDRLYVGIQDFEGRESNDFLIVAPPSKDSDAGATTITHDDVRAVRVSRGGAAATLRWWVDTKVTPHRLYWIARDAEGVLLRVTTDGDHWDDVLLPAEAGRPTDVARFRDAVVVLTERGLYQLAKDGGVRELGTVTEKKSPFELSDFFCAAPLAVFRNAIYAGGQRGGTLYRFVEE